METVILFLLGYLGWIFIWLVINIVSYFFSVATKNGALLNVLVGLSSVVAMLANLVLGIGLIWFMVTLFLDGKWLLSAGLFFFGGIISLVFNLIQSPFHLIPAFFLEKFDWYGSKSKNKEESLHDKKVDWKNVWEKEGVDNNNDSLYKRAKEIVIRENKASASFLQRRLKVDYDQAVHALDLLEANGIVGPDDSFKLREVYNSIADDSDNPDLELVEDDAEFELETKRLQEENLLKKYNTKSFREYDTGYTTYIQAIAKKGTPILFEGSVEDVFSVKGQQYIRIYSFSYNTELHGNLEVSDEQASIFVENNSDMDSFYFYTFLTKAEPILQTDGDSDKKIFIEGTLMTMEKVIEV